MTVIILFGGASDERHVSVATAQNVARSLGNPLCWFWASYGSTYDVAVEQLLAHERPFELDFDPKRPAIWPDLEMALDTLPVDDPVFFLALHGGAGEDGTVQRMMEDRAIAFTGSGSRTSAAALDKGRAKELVQDRVKVAESRIVGITDDETIRSAIEVMLERHPRIVLKPVAGGSSRGLFFLDRGGDVDDVVRNIAKLKMAYIIEQFIQGRELTVGVIDRDGEPLALPVVEIELDPGREFDYQGKYLGQGTHEICPAKIPDDMARAAQQAAIAAHESLRCEGYSRTDVMAADDGIYFLELNTLPGLTTSSLVPQELRAAGIEFREFLDAQIELARKRALTANRRVARSAQ
ncbi:MAG TPA: ATP-grasp domain-containing protein [Thermoanaerobaculia bacterium]|jgi:D-alanine-D-alanine ligase|nr:ATP-grasp domain-containing protein [Thermoanaerobaculia bacterium]